jgi:YidC/Oxa1 family membrane protein insertase
MDRNSIVGIVLIAAIFIVFGIVSQPNKEDLARQKHWNDSIALVQKQQNEITTVEQDSIGINKASNDSLKVAATAQKYGEFSQAAYGKNELYTIENELIAVTLSTKGGRPYSVRLKNYRTYDSLPIKLFDGDSTVFNLNFYSQSNAAIATNDLFFTIDSTLAKNTIVKENPEAIKFRLIGENNQYLEYTYTLKPNTYQLDMNIAFFGITDPTSRLSNLDLSWEILSPQQEKGWSNESTYTSLYYKPFNDEVEYFNARSNKPLQEADMPTQVEWISYKDQFFSSVIMSDAGFSNAKMQSIMLAENSGYVKQFKSVIGVPFSADKNNSTSLHFFFGPNKYKLLKKEYGDKKLYDMISVGKNIIKWINHGVIINIFNWLNKSISNYGIIILLLTLIIKIFLLPLTFRSYVSQAKMRVVKPMVDEAIANIPKDKAMERQQKTMEIYKRVGVSPLGGCLPMLLQMPILFAMFRFFPTSIELRQQGFLWATDLSTYDSIFSWSPDWWPFLTRIYGSHISLFTILMTVTTLITMKTSGSAQMGDSQMPGMKTMMYIMPVTFMFFLNKFSAALTYYYFLANMITFGQNYLFKLFIDEGSLLKKLEAKKAKPHKKSRWQQRIEDMQKMQQQASKKRK